MSIQEPSVRVSNDKQQEVASSDREEGELPAIPQVESRPGDAEHRAEAAENLPEESTSALAGLPPPPPPENDDWRRRFVRRNRVEERDHTPSSEEPADRPIYEPVQRSWFTLRRADGPNAISDDAFIRDLEKLKHLRSFLIEQAVPAQPSVLSFGKLNSLFFSEKGRPPNEEEWALLEALTRGLFALLTEPLRRRYTSIQLPKWVPYLVAGLGVVAFIAMVACMSLEAPSPAALFRKMVPFYLVWLASLGAIGGISFVGMNALSVQDDATFDLSNRHFLILRIVLGALFGVVLTLPFGYKPFTKFIESLAQGGADASSGLTVDSLLLLLPFILGFSTSLVITILNQFVEAIQTFFGKKKA